MHWGDTKKVLVLYSTVPVHTVLYREPGKKTPGGAGTHTGHTRDTRAHTGTRITQTNLTTIQTQRHTRTTTRRPKPWPAQHPQGRPGTDRSPRPTQKRPPPASAASSSSTSSAQLELIRRSGASVVHARPCEAKLPSSQERREVLASCETRCELVEMRDGHIFVLDEPPPPPHTHARLFAPSHIPGDATPVSCPYIIYH